MISKWFVFQFIWKHDTWCDNMKKYRMLLIWCFWACHRHDVCFSEKSSLFILVECDSLMYFTVWVHETILMSIFFLIIIKTCIFCNAILLFFQINWSIESCTVDIHKIVNDHNYISWKCIHFCEWDYNICWLCSSSSKSCRLIISEVLIDLLTQDSKFAQDF